MNNELVSLQETPKIPSNWNYEISVKKVRQTMYKWKNLTTELAQELWIAREILDARGRNLPNVANATYEKTWSEYCEEIGVERSTIHRWLTKHFGKIFPKLEQETPLLPEGKYNVIYADPAWEYRNAGISGAAEKHYSTMPTDEICALKIPSVDNSVLFLWATNPLLEDAFSVIKSWGFEYKTNIVWVKERAGQGFYVKGQHELLLICTRGNFTPNNSLYIRSVVELPRQEHSKKPEKFYEIIEEMYPTGTYLELFHRGMCRPKWVCWGNEL